MDAKSIVTKVFASVLLVVIAVAVLWVAPPATRLFLALLALPLESLIVAAIFTSGAPSRERGLQQVHRQHSFGD